jgi:hypothetical protein
MAKHPNLAPIDYAMPWQPHEIDRRCGGIIVRGGERVTAPSSSDRATAARSRSAASVRRLLDNQWLDESLR